MDIFKTPRDAAVAAQRNPVLWPRTDQRFTGYGVMGLTFRSGHYLAMRHIPASSIGPEYRTRYRLEMGWTALVAGNCPDMLDWRIELGSTPRYGDDDRIVTPAIPIARRSNAFSGW